MPPLYEAHLIYASGIDSKGLVNEWNNKAVEITSFTRQEVVGRDLVQEFFTE